MFEWTRIIYADRAGGARGRHWRLSAGTGREGLRIWLRFSDGSQGEVDLSDLVGLGVFQAWEAPGKIAPLE